MAFRVSMVRNNPRDAWTSSPASVPGHFSSGSKEHGCNYRLDLGFEYSAEYREMVCVLHSRDLFGML